MVLSLSFIFQPTNRFFGNLDRTFNDFVGGFLFLHRSSRRA